MNKEQRNMIISSIINKDILPKHYVMNMSDDDLLDHILRLMSGAGMTDFQNKLANQYFEQKLHASRMEGYSLWL